jgi:hypothetical protein
MVSENWNPRIIQDGAELLERNKLAVHDNLTIIYTGNGHNLAFLPEVARSETGHSQYTRPFILS